MIRFRTLFLSAAAALVVAPHAAFAQPQPGDLPPDLIPATPSEIQLSADGNLLLFSVTNMNLGIGPAEIAGGEVLANGMQEVIQHVYQTNGGIRDVLAGTFIFHDAHNHIHYQRFDLYELQPLEAAGGSFRQGAKTSFCLLDNAKINHKLPGAPKKPVYTTCNRFVQGISVGWGDTYRYYLEGQSLDFSGNPSGTYRLKITVNPDGNLVETDYSNNVACAIIYVDRDSGLVELVDDTCNPPNPSASIDAISPNIVVAGQSHALTITGSGFTGLTAADVSFLNGSGKTPEVTGLAVVDDGTMVATVSVAKGGSPSDPVWDLQVGPTMKVDALTVIR